MIVTSVYVDISYFSLAKCVLNQSC